MQDQHSANDIENGEEYKPHHPPVTLHILLLTDRNVLKHVGKDKPIKSCWSNWPPEQPVLTDPSAFSHLGKGWNGVQGLCSCNSPSPVLLHLLLTTAGSGGVCNEHTLGPRGVTAIWEKTATHRITDWFGKSDWWWCERTRNGLGGKDLKNHWVPPPFHQTWLLHNCPPETLVHTDYQCLKISFFQQVLNKSCYKANPLEKLGKGWSNYRVMLTTGDKIQLKYLILQY